MIEIREFKIVNDKWLKLNVAINQDCQHSTSGTYDGAYIDTISIVTKGKFSDDSIVAAIDDILVNKALHNTLQADSSFTNKFTPVDIDDMTNRGIKFNNDVNIIEVNINIDLDGCACLLDKIFYLKVKADKPSSSTVCTTCAYTNWSKEVYVDKQSMYKKIACVAHNIEGCNIPNHLIDYLMRLKALESAINVYKEDINDDYSNDINTYYQELILTPKTNVHIKTCKCRN